MRQGRKGLTIFAVRISCVVCGSAAQVSCSSCESCRFCSVTCKETDTALHKQLCSHFSTLPPRPSVDHRLALVFPEREPSPHLLWVELGAAISISHRSDDVGASGPLPKLRGVLGSNMYHSFALPTTCEVAVVDRQQQQQRSLEQAMRTVREGLVLVFQRAHRDQGGCAANESIRRCTAPYGVGQFPWKGPVVVALQALDDPVKDVTMAAAHLVVKHFVRPDNYLWAGLKESLQAGDCDKIFG